MYFSSFCGASTRNQEGMWRQARTPSGSSSDTPTARKTRARTLNPAQRPSQRRLAFRAASKEHLGHSGANAQRAGVPPASDEYPVTSTEYYGRSIPQESYRQHAIMALTLIVAKIRNPFRVTSGGVREGESGRFLRSRWKNSLFHSLSSECFKNTCGSAWSCLLAAR